MPKLLNLKFPEGSYLFLYCDSNELKRSSYIIFSVSERHHWAVVGELKSPKQVFPIADPPKRNIFSCQGIHLFASNSHSTVSQLVSCRVTLRKSKSSLLRGVPSGNGELHWKKVSR